MKKAYYVYSIFEKLNLTPGFKALAVLLVFSISFFGVSSEVAAQNLSTGFANVDQSFLKGFEFKEDKGSAREILGEQQQLLQDVQATTDIDEVVTASKLYFVNTLAQNIGQTSSVMAAVTQSHLSLTTFVKRYNDSMQPHIDVEGIVTDYAKLLQ
ncbi:MAG: hypothetical protein HKN67_03925 [Saprospiraceae bacterium]|nr:hypothetical protein [Saprospiraceae bacterium]